ncbi:MULTISPECIES: hypothetical protein [Sphingomonas]|uniref:hypothetical protein n=1 Tax=Sphingomonas TaxID=13687 RepID=UPI001454D035|nr:hypothetical protein [Sphingomonas sp. CCH10-B3]
MKSARLVPGCTGAEAVAALKAAGEREGVHLHDLVRDLHKSPTTYVAQLARAARPQKATIEKLNARLADPRRFGKAAAESVAPEQPIPKVATASSSRDPCFRCGVRGDIGCSCHARGAAA